MKTKTYAWFWIRHLALSIDILILTVIFWAFSLFLKWDELMFYITTLFSLLYFTLFHYVLWQSLWKLFLWIRVVKKDDQSKLCIMQSLIRYLATILSALPLFLWYIWCLFDFKKRTLHDYLAWTVVIKTKNVSSTVVILWNLLVSAVFVVCVYFVLMKTAQLRLDPSLLKSLN